MSRPHISCCSCGFRTRRSGTPAPARLGITASRRVGGAVVRNRAKRLVREAFRATPELWFSGPQSGGRGAQRPGRHEARRRGCRVAGGRAGHSPPLGRSPPGPGTNRRWRRANNGRTLARRGQTGPDPAHPALPAHSFAFVRAGVSLRAFLFAVCDGLPRGAWGPQGQLARVPTPAPLSPLPPRRLRSTAATGSDRGVRL